MVMAVWPSQANGIYGNGHGCVCGPYIHFQGINPTEAAAASLERIIAVAQQSIDRTYTIQVIDEYPASTPRNEKQENIDGAILHVRGPDDMF